MSDRVDPFVAQLAALCRELPTAPKWVFVPSRPIGHTLAERLARERTPWANLRFTLPLDLAVAMAAPALVSRGIDPAPEGLGPALVMRLLLDLPAAPAYFRPLAEQPAMAEALWSTIRELRLAGVTATSLPAEAFAVAEKHAELQALLASYERYLVEHRLADEADVYRAALSDLAAAPIAAGDVRVELPGVIWSPLERQLLDALPGRVVRSRALALPSFQVPKGSEAPPEPTSDAERLAWLMEPAAAPAPHRDGTVTMFRAAGREAEIEHVLRLIAKGGRRLDEVEIACASVDQAAMVWDKATRHGWPVTLAAGVPAAQTRPGRALLGFLAWAEDGFAAATLRRLLQSGDMKLGLGNGPSPGHAARLLAGAKVTWHRTTYAPAFQAVVQNLESRSKDPDLEDELAAAYRQRAEQARQVNEVIQSLLALVPDAANGIRLGVVLGGARRFLERHATILGDLDAAATKALDEALGELSVLDALSLPLGDAVRLLRDRVAAVRVGASRARPGALHVTSLAQAGYAGRPHTFVVGLEEGHVLPAALEDPVLLDDEREKLRGARLPTSRDRLSEALQSTLARLAALGGHVCLSFSCLQVREGRETFPSWLLLQGHRLCSGRPDASYDDLRDALGPAVTAVPARPDEALDDSRWWLAALDGTGRNGVAAVETAFPALRRGREAEAERESDRFTEWDGFVPAAGSRLDPRTSSRPLAPTRLEEIASCPFRHLLERGLHLEPIEDAVPDLDAWLDPGTRGVLLHDLFADILRELRRRKERVDPVRHGQLARTLAEEHLARLRAKMPPPAQHVYEREAHELLRDVDLFLQGETLDPGREPIGFEVSFGTADADGEPLSQAEPVTIDLGNGLSLTLRGRIDRLDRVGPDEYEIVDYKTGGFYAPRWSNGVQFAGGRQLQHALYALVAEQLLRREEPGARVTRASYYFPSDRGGGERVTRPVGPRQAVGNVFRELADVVASGAFVHSAQDSDCTFCKMRRACGRRAAQRAGLKTVNPANTPLAPYVRLRRND